jgi:hypothetical protein
MSEPTFRVEDGHYIEGGNRIAASCHHLKRARGPKLRACGGCYRRLMDVLGRIQQGAPRTIVDDLFAELRAEGRR